jgi:hypothetical protein
VAAERKNLSIQRIVSKLSQIPRLKRKKSKDELFLVINGESKIPSPLLSLSSKSLLSNLSGYFEGTWVPACGSHEAFEIVGRVWKEMWEGKCNRNRACVGGLEKEARVSDHVTYLLRPQTRK